MATNRTNDMKHIQTEWISGIIQMAALCTATQTAPNAMISQMVHQMQIKQMFVVHSYTIKNCK
jgi:hypothetical protein